MSRDNAATDEVGDREQPGGESSQQIHEPQQSVSTGLREHEQLTDILSLIPHKIQRGLQTQYEVLMLTALDANQYFIALGSNVGVVFLYDRAKQKIERLRSEDTTDIVTCVCLHHGLDDHVAIGHASGSIYIFQLPNLMIGHSKQLERFIVADLHEVSLKCLAWSTNGMRVFSGDMQGCVGCTEVDFYEKECKSSVLLIEPNTEIVQLHHGHKSLLVSTKHRCIVYRMDGKQQITQVGSKDRKVHADFGACFIPAMCKPEDAQLYASRPGFRIWKASVNGSVINTFMLKELLTQSHTQIPLLDFQVTCITKSKNPYQFGQMLLFRDKELVTWNDSCLYVIHPETSSIVGSQKHLGMIKVVAVTDSEVFVLREGTDRNLIRISEHPISRPVIPILKQLEIERREDTAQPSIKKLVKKTEKIEKQTGSSEKSPFKIFQGNLLDKVKQIANPALIVDKVQEKLNSEMKTNELERKAVQGNKREVSPPGDLPPVVLLNSPDLLTISIGGSAIGSNSPEELTSSQAQASCSDIQHSELTESVNQSDVRKTGSGAFTALARLQNDHNTEETSDPVCNIASQTSESTKQNVKISVADFKGEDGIVFRRKAKHKKKKKKGYKDRASVRLDPDLIDSDSISVNSVASAASDSSENASSVQLSTNDECVPALNQVSHIENPQLQPENLVLQPATVGIGVQATQPVPMIKDEVTEMNRLDVEQDVRNNEIKTKDADKTEPVVTDDRVSYNKKTKVEDDEESIPRSAARGSDIEHVNVPLEIQKEMLWTDLTLPKNEVVEVSNLDKEVARLDSYLSETSDSASTDLENSTPGKYSSEYRSEVEQHSNRSIFKRSDSVKEREILNSIEESDSKYTPSSLEQELVKLEMKTMREDSRNLDKDELNYSLSLTSPTSPRSFEDAYSPSTYTIYNKPGTTAEDFYSKYTPTSQSSLTSDSEADKKEDINSGIAVPVKPQFLKSVNTWTEISAQGNIHSISVSSTHVWITDRSSNIFYSNLSEPGVSWKKASGTASQISVSPDGYIIWGLNRNTVYAGTKITAKRPEGMKWVEAVRDVSYICVDNTCAWYIKTNHQVMMQKGLSRDRPCYTGQAVECKHRLKQVVCQDGVVWALTENCHWLYRAGITPECHEGKEWKSGDSGTDNRLFTHLSLGEESIGWAIDIVGQAWFCPGVTMETPRGENHWWQVPLSGEYIIKDLTAMDMLKSFSKKFDPQKLTLLLSAQSGGLMWARNGVWVCPEYKHILQVCRGSIEGQIWREAHPESLAASSCWKTVVASTASHTNGLVWAQQPNGDIFSFSHDLHVCHSILGPRKQPTSSLFVCMSVCTDALWCLTDDGDVFIRTGMSELEPKGSGWSHLDLSQLDDRQLVHVSCANMNVWSVDCDGMVWHRIGVKAPSDLSLNAAWLPVDNGGTVFTQVVSGQQDWKVWAIDNRRQVYVRQGITPHMPIGRKWIHVSGSPAMHLTLSDNFVFALNHAGELLCRYGVSPDHVTGDYWKKLPGELTHFSATPTNVLWGINKDGQLVRRHTKYIVRKANDPPEIPSGARRIPRGSSVGSEDADWEFV